MTALDLPAIRALLEGATPGPWEFNLSSDWEITANGDALDYVASVSDHGDQSDYDAAFIAAAPSIVAQLVAVVERVEGLHRMMPGSHERAYGPECRCGKSWPCAEALNIRAAITGRASE